MKFQKRAFVIAPAVIAFALIGASPASAAAGGNGSCVGQIASTLNEYPYPGLGGRVVSTMAHAGVVSTFAKKC